MPMFPRRTYGIPSSLPSLFSNLLSLDRSEGGEIKDDWELIDLYDWGNACDEDYPTDADMIESHFLNISSKRRYVFLRKADVLQLVEDKITEVSNVLLLERKKAALLLQHSKWDVNQTYDDWLECEEKVCKRVGLFMTPVAETLANAAEITCIKCYTDFPRDAMLSVSCGHQICRSCWEGYIREAINDGPQCLTLRCPEPSCDAAVDFDLIRILSSEDDTKKFENHLLRSYLACTKEGRWCPAPECDYAVFSSNSEEDNVTCQCLHSFCWNCSGEAHAPVDCKTFTRWMLDIVSKSSEYWLLANMTTCPKCTVKVEKVSNTSYEECSTCGHKYCSVCGDDCGDADYWLHSCRPDDQRSLYEISFRRYNYCYTGWATCDESRANAITDFKMVMELQLELLCVMFGISAKDLDFLGEALLQVADCWQVLKWTHVYGYYLPAENGVKERLLQFLQEDAARHLRQVQKEVEALLQVTLDKDCPSEEFLRFRSKILRLTSVTRNYFDRLMEGLKDGLSEVASSLKPSLKHKMSQDDEEEKGCIRETLTQNLNTSPSSSPTAKIMRSIGDMDIRGSVGNSNPDELCTDFSPEHKTKPKVE